MTQETSHIHRLSPFIQGAPGYAEGPGLGGTRLTSLAVFQRLMLGDKRIQHNVEVSKSRPAAPGRLRQCRRALSTGAIDPLPPVALEKSGRSRSSPNGHSRHNSACYRRLQRSASMALHASAEPAGLNHSNTRQYRPFAARHIGGLRSDANRLERPKPEAP